MGDLIGAARALSDRDRNGAETLAAVLAKAFDSRTPFYGRIVISFSSGIITCVAKEETFKPVPTSLGK